MAIADIRYNDLFLSAPFQTVWPRLASRQQGQVLLGEPQVCELDSPPCAGKEAPPPVGPPLPGPWPSQSGWRRGRRCKRPRPVWREDVEGEFGHITAPRLETSPGCGHPGDPFHIQEGPDAFSKSELPAGIPEPSSGRQESHDDRALPGFSSVSGSGDHAALGEAQRDAPALSPLAGEAHILLLASLKLLPEVSPL